MSAAHLAYWTRLRLLRAVLRGRAGRALLGGLLRTWRLQLLTSAERVRQQSIADFNADMAYATSLQQRAERLDDVIAQLTPPQPERPPCT